MFLEHGYGDRLGSSDEQIAPLVGGLRSREELFAQCDVLLLPKPLAEDLGRCARARSSGAGRTASRTAR